MEYDTNTRMEDFERMGDARDEIQSELLNMDLDGAFALLVEEGIDTHTYAALIDDMYWDGHSVFDIKQQIQVLEGDTSI